MLHQHLTLDDTKLPSHKTDDWLLGLRLDGRTVASKPPTHCYSTRGVDRLPPLQKQQDADGIFNHKSHPSHINLSFAQFPLLSTQTPQQWISFSVWLHYRAHYFLLFSYWLLDERAKQAVSFYWGMMKKMFVCRRVTKRFLQNFENKFWAKSIDRVR